MANPGEWNAIPSKEMELLRKESQAKIEAMKKEMVEKVYGKGNWTNMMNPRQEGLKYDDNKPRVDLLDSSWLEGVGNVLGFGARKYAAHNWRSGIAVLRNVGAALRHIYAFLRREDVDPESGLHHLLHASCCLMFAYWTVVNKPELDDRWKP
jgi:hypothetical protein